MTIYNFCDTLSSSTRVYIYANLFVKQSFENAVDLYCCKVVFQRLPETARFSANSVHLSMKSDELAIELGEMSKFSFIGASLQS